MKRDLHADRPILDTYKDINIAIRHLEPHVADRGQIWKLMVEYFTVDLDLLAIALTAR